MTYRHPRLRAVALALRRTVLFALLVESGLTPIFFSQNRQTPAPQAPAATPQPFDPHDISGIWRNPGGFDPIIGMDRPPMTEWERRSGVRPGPQPEIRRWRSASTRTRKTGTIRCSCATRPVTPATWTTATTGSSNFLTNS